MGGSRKLVLIGLGMIMVMGIAVYMRLWTMDYRISSDETELIRKQFDLANREAMDESAEWRLKYDQEFDKSTKCANQLNQIREKSQSIAFKDHCYPQMQELKTFDERKEDILNFLIKNSYHKKIKDAANNIKQLEMIQKENIGLLERVEALTQELESEKLKCSMRQT